MKYSLRALLRPKASINMLKTILHIDYDSFFASVEQQANPFLRGKPIGVTGSSLSRGVVCAASREAKKFGVKTGMPLFEAKKICPDIIPVKGDGSKYSYIQKKTLEIFTKYTDTIEPFSIDESFLDVTQTLPFFDNALSLSKSIKENLRAEFGDYITCSIGISFNKLLAKLASDINKPDGVCLIDESNLQEILITRKLTDFCGIGRRIEARLNAIGVHTVAGLQEAPFEILYQEFGIAEANFLKDLSFGKGNLNVNPLCYKREKPKSIGHQHTLSTNTSNPITIKQNIHRLCEMASKRLRTYSMVGKTIHLSIRSSNREWFGKHSTLLYPTNSEQDIYEVCCDILESMKWKKSTRLVGVSISNLQEENSLTLNLFADHTKSQTILKTKDLINNTFGDFTMVTADTIKADRTKGKISSFLRYL